MKTTTDFHLKFQSVELYLEIEHITNYNLICCRHMSRKSKFPLFSLDIYLTMKRKLKLLLRLCTVQNLLCLASVIYRIRLGGGGGEGMVAITIFLAL